MPPARFAALILAVLAAAGVTIGAWTLAGLPLAALGLGALAGALVLGRGGVQR